MTKRIRATRNEWGELTSAEVNIDGYWRYLSLNRLLINQYDSFGHQQLKVVSKAVNDDSIRIDDNGNFYYHTLGGDKHNKVVWE